MELWIRSQEETILSKAINLIVRENQNENNETNYAIVDIYTMGIYKSKKRALEVLDEIQSKIAENKCLEVMLPKVTDVRGYEEQYGRMFKETIYQMPKE